MRDESYVIALAGNPNIGKSTVFNRLTGLRQHTGNWSGKTVVNAKGSFKEGGVSFTVVDLPGAYSLFAQSEDEEAARHFLEDEDYEAAVVVLDATALERSLIFGLQIRKEINKVIFCVNLMDEARKKNIQIDIDKLSVLLNAPVAAVSARSGEGFSNLTQLMLEYCRDKGKENQTSQASEYTEPEAAEVRETMCADIVAKAGQIAAEVVREDLIGMSVDRRIDNIVTHKKWGPIIMLFLLVGVFWLTITGANYPSQVLLDMFNRMEALLYALMDKILPDFVVNMLVAGGYRTLTWIVAVMLPPMIGFKINHCFLESLYSCGFLNEIVVYFIHHFYGG